MTVYRCPDCKAQTDCETCQGTRYVHRNSHGRITHPASPKEALDDMRAGKKPGRRPSPQGYR